MSIDLKKELGGNSLGGQWLVGRTENLPVQPGKGVFQYNNMTLITRDAQNTILASDYPDFYNLSNGFYPGFFYYARYTSGLTAPVYADSHDTTVIAVGAAGKISRSTDTGVTWSVISSGVSADLAIIHYNVTNTKWYIPYAANKCLISTDDGLTWVDTTCTGLTWDNSSCYYMMRMESIAGTTVFSNGFATYRTTNGVTWTVVNTAGKLAQGNGWFTLLHQDCTAHASQDGTTWTALNSGLAFKSYANLNSAFNMSYGVVYTGIRWIVATTDYRDFTWFQDSGIPRTSPIPTNSIATPAWSVNYYAYSTTSNPTSSWTYFTVTYPASTSSSWMLDGGHSTYFQQINSPGFTVGMFSVVGDVFSLVTGFGPDANYVHTSSSFEAWHQANLTAHYPTSYPVSIVLSAASPATALDITGMSFYSDVQRNGITRGNLVWGKGTAFLTLSGSGTAPARVLPTYTNPYGGEGTACTRIK